MTMQAHEALAEIDEIILADAQALCQQALAAGWRADELPVVLRPWLQQVAAVRARALARLERWQCTTH